MIDESTAVCQVLVKSSCEFVSRGYLRRYYRGERVESMSTRDQRLDLAYLEVAIRTTSPSLFDKMDQLALVIKKPEVRRTM